MKNIENKTLGSTIIKTTKLCFKYLQIFVRHDFSWLWLNIVFSCVPILFKLLGPSKIFMDREYLRYCVCND